MVAVRSIEPMKLITKPAPPAGFPLSTVSPFCSFLRNPLCFRAPPNLPTFRRPLLS